MNFLQRPMIWSNVFDLDWAWWHLAELERKLFRLRFSLYSQTMLPYFGVARPILSNHYLCVCVLLGKERVSFLYSASIFPDKCSHLARSLWMWLLIKSLSIFFLNCIFMFDRFNQFASEALSLSPKLDLHKVYFNENICVFSGGGEKNQQTFVYSLL